MVKGPSANSRRARSITRAQMASAVGSRGTTDIPISTAPFHRWGKPALLLFGEGGLGAPVGKIGGVYTRPTGDRLGAGGELTLFLPLGAPARRGSGAAWAGARGVAILAARPSLGRALPNAQVTGEEDLPAQQPPTLQDPRVPGPH